MANARSLDLDTAHEGVPSALTCAICQELMLAPYTLACGHSFCGNCLRHWLRNGEGQKTCPHCRASVPYAPAPSHNLRELALHVLGLLEKDDPAAAAHAKSLGNDKFDPRLFDKITFQRPLRDDQDDVMRCELCHWELEDGVCMHCGREYNDSDRSDDTWSRAGPVGVDESEEVEFDSDEASYVGATAGPVLSHSETDSEDDSFIDSRNTSEIEQDEDSDSNTNLRDYRGQPLRLPEDGDVASVVNLESDQEDDESHATSIQRWPPFPRRLEARTQTSSGSSSSSGSSDNDMVDDEMAEEPSDDASEVSAWEDGDGAQGSSRARRIICLDSDGSHSEESE